MIGFTECQCKSCGVVHHIPTALYNGLRENGGYYNCPNGHSWGWDKAQEKEVERIRRDRDRAIQERARLEEENAEKDKKIVRLEKRASAGICPCCTRTFTNMARHIKTKHPELLATNVVKLKAKA